ncbi:hypothetical protein HYW55_04800 [Candidatus Gottesmanbacteria bacterium]|nr:hypothetical protein [Candidatus Gottesmanbacteria bacterium]
MKKIQLIQLGVGNVGKALIGQITRGENGIKKRFNIDICYYGLFNSKGGIFSDNGLSNQEIRNFPAKMNAEIKNVINKVNSSFILLDLTASDATFPFLYHALQKGASVVLANKRPLAGPYTQYKLLHSFKPNQILHETTVGAGLPVIRTLKTLLATGDEIISITGCFSGTLGFICSSIEEGKSFSESVRIARKIGYTEFDPREDLSGNDVARKVIILARMIGQKIEMKDIQIKKLYPPEYEKFTVDEFMTHIVRLDSLYIEKFKKAKKKNKVLRFVADISKKNCTIGLREVEKENDIGTLTGPDNIVIFTTKYYLSQPLVIKGPGAGPFVTASGVFGDILTIGGVL